MTKNLKGGFLAIPSMGIKDKMTDLKNKVFPPKKPETHYSLIHIEQGAVPPQPRPLMAVTQNKSALDQSLIDENRKKCLDIANEKIKLANEDKKQCELKNPRKKIFGIFGGKRKGGKYRSQKKRKNMRSTRKTTTRK